MAFLLKRSDQLQKLAPLWSSGRGFVSTEEPSVIPMNNQRLTVLFSLSSAVLNKSTDS